MANQTEITGPVDFPPEAGSFGHWGFARRMVFRYHRNKIRCRPFGLKEWDFYQVLGGDWVLQLTIGHVSYVASFAATLFNLKSGERHSAACMRALPLRGLPMEENPETPHILEAAANGWKMRFAVEQTRRVLTVSGHDKKAGPVEIELVLANDIANEKMVIATPFAAGGQFYLNYKENYWAVRGRAAIGETAVEFGPGANALLDWGRGVWPFRHQWFWGNGTGMVGGKKFGLTLAGVLATLPRPRKICFSGRAGPISLERLKRKYLLAIPGTGVFPAKTGALILP